ncbi:MAG: helix-turn-helix domain-containing protein [Oscillospiraceae bacterium]|nr:helix-turn-helix domain-containing protein [Oscillospiraceae bacterium]
MRQCTQNLINQHLMDINPILAGWVTDWEASPVWEKQRYHMLVFYVQRGEFTLVTKDASYPVHAGQIFFIPLDDHTSYTIGKSDIYDFIWVGFTGSLSHRFAELPRVLDIGDDQLPHLRTLRQFSPHTAYDLAADLLLLRSALLDDNEPKCDYVQYVIDYIQKAYMLPITVESLAEQVGLDRSYLSRLFKERTGTTLQNHLQFVRFHQAKNLLVQGYSIKEAAYKSGFTDDKNFHKVFLRREGMTPTVWKKHMLENLATLQNKWPRK